MNRKVGQECKTERDKAVARFIKERYGFDLSEARATFVFWVNFMIGYLSRIK